MHKSLLFFCFIITVITGNAQNDTIVMEQLRTESGVDPTRINSRVGYTIMHYFNRDNNRSQITNRASLILGVNRWSFSFKPEITSLHNGIEGTGFQTGMGDFKFSILNAFYVAGKQAVAGAVEFGLPFARNGFGTPYYTATPSLTYSYTFNPSLFLAIQPQYTFALAKDAAFPDINIITIRTFLAKFLKSGYFFVFEPRTIYDSDTKNFDLIVSPIIGKSLGGGFNLMGIMEIPTNSRMINDRGLLFQFGFNKNF